MVWSMLMLLPYLESKHFTIKTDHNSTMWILNLANVTGCSVWLCLILSKANLHVAHLAEIKYQISGALFWLQTTIADTWCTEDVFEVSIVTCFLSGFSLNLQLTGKKYASKVIIKHASAVELLRILPLCNYYIDRLWRCTTIDIFGICVRDESNVPIMKICVFDMLSNVAVSQTVLVTHSQLKICLK